MSPEESAEELSDIDSALSSAGIGPSGAEKKSPEILTPTTTVKTRQEFDDESEEVEEALGKNQKLTSEKLSARGREAKPNIRRQRTRDNIVEDAPGQTPEDAPVETPAGTPAQPKTPETPPEEEADSEIDALKEPQDLPPKKAADWRTLRQKAKEYKKKYGETEKKFGEAVDYIGRLQKTKGELPENVTAELAELRKFRAAVDLRQDPQFVERFDKKIQGNANEIFQILMAHGMTEEDVKKVKQVDAIRNYGKHSKWWKEKVFDVLEKNEANPQGAQDAILIRKKIEENVALDWDREKALQENVGKLDEYQAQQKEAWEQKTKQDAAEVDTIVADWQKTINIPFIKPLEMPTNATPEQKAQVTAHNKKYQEIADRFTNVYQATSPNLPARSRAEIAGASTLAFLQAEEIDKLLNEKNALLQENQKLKGAGTIANAGRAAPQSRTAPRKNLLDMSDLEAIDYQLQEALKGGN